MAGRDTSARHHGTIQKGETGDKTPGFDPAAVPLETDAEAGGTPTPPGLDDQTSRVVPEHTNATSYASAMRPLGERETQGATSWIVLVAAGAAVVAIAALVATVWN
jgi:hypothetical protein